MGAGHLTLTHGLDMLVSFAKGQCVGPALSADTHSGAQVLFVYSFLPLTIGRKICLAWKKGV